MNRKENTISFRNYCVRWTITQTRKLDRRICSTEIDGQVLIYLGMGLSIEPDLLSEKMLLTPTLGPKIDGLDDLTYSMRDSELIYRFLGFIGFIFLNKFFTEERGKSDPIGHIIGKWLFTPNIYLDDKMPVDFIGTVTGIAILADLLLSKYSNKSTNKNFNLRFHSCHDCLVRNARELKT